MLILVALSLLAAVFALGGLFRASRSTSYQQTARVLYQQRKEELGREVADAQAQEALELEAGRALLQDSEVQDAGAAEPSAPQPIRSRETRMVWILALVIPLCGWLLFINIGDLGVRQVAGAEVVLQLPAETAEDRQAIADWQVKLQARVAAQPEDAKSLYLLAHTHLKQGDYQQAAISFARTSELNPQDLTVKVYWLQARFLSAKGQLDQVSQSLAEELLAQAPNVSVVLEILAMDAVRKGEAEQAIRYLSRALSGARDNQSQTNFVIAINELRKKVNLPGITVEVTAAHPAPAQSTLFVIARPVGGGMPLAVVKLPALLLPQTVRLDDLVTMSGTSKLSDVEAFEVVVRISLGGSPMRQAGDWHWQSAPLNLAETDLLQVHLVAPD